jgi:hypothetical protein
MSIIAAEAALILIWENNPPSIGYSDVLAGCAYIGHDGSTDAVIPSIDVVDPFFVVDRVVKLLPLDCIVGTVDDIGLVEACIVRVVVCWWGLGRQVKNGEGYQQ